MKTALVTGGATGIGKAISQMLVQKGYLVFVTYNNTPVEYSGVNAVKCDLSEIESIKNLFNQIDCHIDLLVNNAGVSLIKMINDVTDGDYEYVTSVNERATYYCSKYAGERMVKQGGGCIVNISSVWGQCGASCETLYSMTKSAIIGLTKALAQELAPSGVTVNCVAPGIIDTRMNQQFDKNELAREVPLGRLGKAEEIAHAVLFFAENSYVTGQVLGVNGGMLV